MDIDGFGERFEGHSPAVVAGVLTLIAFLSIAALLVGVGLFITHGPAHGLIGRWDAGISTWFVSQRTATLNTATVIGSGFGMTEVIVGLELVAIIVLAIVRRWRDLAFLVLVVSLEASVALATSLIVDRPRPMVERLDIVPPTKSFPSGHTAAAIALYVGLATLIVPHIRHRLLRAVVWVVATLIPLIVGFSRIYRGMHHATDVLGSLLLGALVIWAAWMIVGCTASVWRHRQDPVPEAVGSRSVGPLAEVSG